MAAPNAQSTFLSQQVASSADGIQLLPGAFQRSNPMQSGLQAMPLCYTVNNNANGGALANVAPNTCANQTITVMGVVSTDIMLNVTKATAQAGLGIVGLRPPLRLTQYLISTLLLLRLERIRRRDTVRKYVV